MRHYGKFTTDNITRKDLLLILVSILIIVTIVYFNEYRKEQLLLENKETVAVVKEKYSVYLGGNDLIVEFEIKRNKVRSKPIHNHECYKSLKEGDSVKIIYSISKPEVVDVIDCKPLYRR